MTTCFGQSLTILRSVRAIPCNRFIHVTNGIPLVLQFVIQAISLRLNYK
jgi:hypothetical protein